jgi:hypothetical protein
MNTIYARIDTLIDQLREDAKCGSGSKSCGKVCIPQEKNCLGETAKAFGGGAAQALAGPLGSGTYRALRSQGRSRRTSIAGAIGANVAASVGSVALASYAMNKAKEGLRDPVNKGVSLGKGITKMADKDFEKAKKKGK